MVYMKEIYALLNSMMMHLLIRLFCVQMDAETEWGQKKDRKVTEFSQRLRKGYPTYLNLYRR